MQTPGLSAPLQTWVRSRYQPRPQVAGKGDPKTQDWPADAPEKGVWGKEATVPSGGWAGEVALGSLPFFKFPGLVECGLLQEGLRGPGWSTVDSYAAFSYALLLSAQWHR